MPNVYYNPEDFGLVIVGSTELSEPCYSFDTLVVWQHIETGEFYAAHDSGCSCPSPFEDFSGVEDLDGPFTWHEASNHILSYTQDEVENEREYEKNNREYRNSSITDLISLLLSYR